MSEKENALGVPDVECTSVGPSATSPQAITPSGLSATVPDAPAHIPAAWLHEKSGDVISHEKREGMMARWASVFGSEDSVAKAYRIPLFRQEPSREIIEKLERDLAQASIVANEAALATLFPGTQLNIDKVNELLDQFRATLTEARAFLNKNVEP